MLIVQKVSVNAVVFLDLKKGLQYDRPHDITVSAYGIREKFNAYSWFKSYLEHRIQIIMFCWW